LWLNQQEVHNFETVLEQELQQHRASAQQMLRRLGHFMGTFTISDGNLYKKMLQRMKDYD
jgi:hypothetical protein